MFFNIILIVLAIGIGYLIFKRKKSVVINEIKDELLADTELKYLKVYCESCGDTEIKSGSTIPIKRSGCFYAKGFNLEGKEVKLNEKKLSWNASCGCVSFANKTAINNCIGCSLGNVRDIWIKYSNNVSFSWKIDFGK